MLRVGVTKVEDILVIFDCFMFLSSNFVQYKFSMTISFFFFFAICHCQRKKGGKPEVGRNRNDRMEKDNTGLFGSISFLTNSSCFFLLEKGMKMAFL